MQPARAHEPAPHEPHVQAAPEPHAAPPQQDTSHFFRDDKGNPISLLADPIAYIKAIGAAATAHVAEPAAPATATPAATPAAGVDPTQFKHQLNDVTSIAIASQLATYSHGMTDTTSKAFIQTLDKIDDPDLRHKVMAQFETQTHQSLDAFIRNNKDWNNNGDNRDKTAALQLISKDRDTAEDNLAKLSPEERAKKEDEADKIARDIVSATSAHDHSDGNQQKIFRGLGGRTPEEIELIRAKVEFHTHGESNLYQKIDDGTHKGDEDEAVTMLAGDRVASARAALANEDDPKRLREVVTGLKPAEIDKLRADPDKDKLLARITNPSDRSEINALLNNNRAGADAEHIGNLLKPKKEGLAEGAAGAYDKIGQDNYDRRKPANVLKELEGMSGEDVKAAAAAWGTSHPGEPSFEAMLQTRWGDDGDKTEYNRILAMIHGDKGKNRSLRVQEGMRENDQDEVEAALAHEKADTKALQAENASFERNNVEADQQSRQVVLDMTGHANELAVGRSTEDQLTAHYDAEDRKDIGGSTSETMIGGDAAKMIHADRQKKHLDKAHDDRIGAMELLDKGKLSTETEVHRGKGAKEKAEALEGITSNKALAEAQEQYRIKYGGKEMLPYSGDDRKDMNANELMIENIRLYGVKADRPAQVEYLLQLQQYEKQYSKALEMDEAGDAGGGTQRWQRQELASMHDMLKDPKLQAFDHQVVQGKNALPFMVDNPNEPTFDQIDKLLPMKGANVADGLKDGVSKHDFSSLDKGMTEANKAEEGAKKRMADRIVKIFSTIAKIAAALTAQPELIALIDVAEGLIEMGVKWQVMGEAYDPAEDAKMLAFTAAADIALMGFSKAGSMKGELAAAERQALGAGEKTAMEMEHAVSGEAKAEALSEGAHVAAGESTALKGAFEEGASAEKALGSEAAGSVGSRVEQKVADVAEGRAVREGETVAAKTVEGEGAGAAKEALSPQELAQQIEKRYSLAGAGAKMAIQTVGGGIVHDKSPSDILKGLVTGGLGLVLPGHLSEKVKGAIGNDSLAQKILGEVASFSTELTANTTINVAGGGEAGDVMVDQLIGLGGSRVQRLGGAGHAAPAHEEEQVRGELPSGATETTSAPVEPTTNTLEPTTLPAEPVSTTPVPTREATPVEPVTNTEPHVVSTDEGTMKAISAADETSGAKQPPSPEKVVETPATVGDARRKLADRDDSLFSKGDPVHDKYGAAQLSHPEEYEATIKELEEAGVDVDYRPGNFAYSPEKGGPGRMIFDPEGSIGALRHEFQHFKDIQAAGFPGMKPYLQDPMQRWTLEYRAYMEEINFCRSEGDFDTARRILENMRAEKSAIFAENEPEAATNEGAAATPTSATVGTNTSDTVATPQNPTEGAASSEEARRRQIVEVYSGPSLDSARDLAARNPDAQITAAESTFLPEAKDIGQFEAEGGRFLPERFGESLPPSSVDDMKVRYPLPHAKGVENMAANLRQEAEAELAANPGDIAGAYARAAARLEGQIESVTNLGPHALDKLTPGGTLDVTYWEKEIESELRALTERGGGEYGFEIASGPNKVPRSIAPESGFGIPDDLESVTQMILTKVQSKP